MREGDSTLSEGLSVRTSDLLVGYAGLEAVVLRSLQMRPCFRHSSFRLSIAAYLVRYQLIGFSADLT